VKGEARAHWRGAGAWKGGSLLIDKHNTCRVVLKGFFPCIEFHSKSVLQLLLCIMPLRDVMYDASPLHKWWYLGAGMRSRLSGVKGPCINAGTRRTWGVHWRRRTRTACMWSQIWAFPCDLLDLSRYMWVHPSHSLLIMPTNGPLQLPSGAPFRSPFGSP